MSRLARLLILALVIPAPSRAGEEAACWSYDATPGLFGWTQPPSTACRDGQTVTGAPSLPAPPAPRDDAATPPPSDKDETGFTFSGSAYVGIVATF